MKDADKTKAQLIEETVLLRRHIAELEKREAERTETEASLKKSEKRYRTLAEAAHDIIFVVDRQDQVEYINNFGAALFGLRQKDIIGKKDRALLPDTLHKQREKLHDVFTSGLPLYHETLSPFPKGDLWLSTLLVPILDDAGQVASVMGIARDITDHKRVQEALRESEEKYRLLFYHSPIGILYYDTELRITDCNNTFVENLHSRLEELSGLNIKNIRDQRVLPALKKALEGEEGFYEGPYQATTSTSTFLVCIRTSPLFGPGNKVKGGIAIVEDISERKRTEASLLESEQTLRAITDTAPDTIILINDSGKIIYWNASAMRMLGYLPEELKNMSVLKIIPERYQDAHTKAFSKFVASGQGLIVGDTYEVFALRKDGTEIPIELSVSGVRLNGTWHSAGIIRDISERKKLEAQLLHSQKLEAIGQLAGGVAHDFNNVLTAIIGYAHVLLMKMQGDDQLRPTVSHLLEAADRAALLTQSLLVFSRKQVLNPRQFDLNDLIQRVGKFLQRIIGEDVELRAILHTAPVITYADPGQIEQVLMNLATNARDAMPQGGSFTIEISMIELDNSFIRAHGYGRKGSFARILVTDTGSGINKDMAKKIFEPFFTTKEAGKGTGLGLSIAYGIIKQHHGYINVYSEQGMGTTFKIYLPLIKTEDEQKHDPAVIPDKELPRGTETVLIAEDDGVLRNLSRDVLEEVGYTVIEAENGDDAINKFLQNKDTIQLVILDMIMPRKSGKEAYDAMIRVRPDIKTIFISGYSAERLRTENFLGENMELILKPLSPRTLIKKVREMLDK